mmetsp:Transcript_10281/g.18546  ORF Transcript_10281/g.18546 Transcript_10281/m.18546 type:complete len:204 (+) Transcript_10281:239-850(+)
MTCRRVGIIKNGFQTSNLCIFICNLILENHFQSGNLFGLRLHLLILALECSLQHGNLLVFRGGITSIIIGRDNRIFLLLFRSKHSLCVLCLPLPPGEIGKQVLDLILNTPVRDAIPQQKELFDDVVALECIDQTLSSVVADFVFVQPYHAKVLVLLEGSGEALGAFVANVVSVETDHLQCRIGRQGVGKAFGPVVAHAVFAHV